MNIKGFFYFVFFISSINTSFCQKYIDSISIKGIWRTNNNSTLICLDSFLYIDDYCYNFYFSRDTLFLLEKYKQFNNNEYSERYKTEFIDSFNFKIKRISDRIRNYEKLQSCRNVKSFIDTTIKFQGLFFSFSPRFSSHPPFKIEIDSIGNYFLWTRRRLKLYKYNKYSNYSSGKLDAQSFKIITNHFNNSLIDSIPIDGGPGIDAPYYHIDFKFNNRIKSFYGTNFPIYKYDLLESMFELYKIIINDSSVLKTEDSLKNINNKFQLIGNLKSKKGYPKLNIKIIDSSSLIINEISKMYSTELNPDFYNYYIKEDTLYIFKPPTIQEKSFVTNNDSVIIFIQGLDKKKDPQPFLRFSLLNKTVYKSNLNGILYLKLPKSSTEIKFKISLPGIQTETIKIIPNSNKEIILTLKRRRLPYSDEFIFKKRNKENGFYIKTGYPLILEN